MRQSSLLATAFMPFGRGCCGDFRASHDHSHLRDTLLIDVAFGRPPLWAPLVQRFLVYTRNRFFRKKKRGRADLPLLKFLQKENQYGKRRCNSYLFVTAMAAGLARRRTTGRFPASILSKNCGHELRRKVIAAGSSAKRDEIFSMFDQG